jgi:hypothetical protein
VVREFMMIHMIQMKKLGSERPVCFPRSQPLQGRDELIIEKQQLAVTVFGALYGLWARYLTSLCLYFPVCEMGMIKITTRINP